MFKFSFDTSFWGWDSLIKQSSLRSLTDEVIAKKSARAFATTENRDLPGFTEVAMGASQYKLLSGLTLKRGGWRM